MQGYSKETDDSLTTDGAARLARKIETYWRSRGHAVEAVVILFSLERGGVKLAGVRSNMIGAWPRGLADG